MKSIFLGLALMLTKVNHHIHFRLTKKKTLSHKLIKIRMDRFLEENLLKVEFKSKMTQKLPNN